MQAQNKPGVIYFYNVTTRDCKRMDDITLVSPQVQEGLQFFVPVRIEPRDNMQLAQQYNVFKVPSVIFVNPQGEPLDQAIGFKAPELFYAYLSRAYNMYHGAGSSQQAFAPNTSSPAGTASAKPAANAFELTQPRPQTIAYTFKSTAFWQTPPSLIGDFNDWHQDQVIPMDRVGDSWNKTLYLPEGIYEYKLFASGEYFQDADNPSSKLNPYGTHNSIAVVGKPKGVNPIVVPSTSNPGYYDITWGYYDEEAESVACGGTFNNWDPIIMFKNPQLRGEWGIRYTLPPGTYEYKLIIDGEWQNDPYNYTIETESGNRNNVFTVP
jgi:5'-AMP-activated protein kinase regulatory beta subunit